MPLILSLSGGGLPPGRPQTRSLQTGTLSIGRAPGNDWVLADPDRHLSKTHCVITARGGRYVLTDRSSNGIYVNDARQPTQRDTDVDLADGDELRLGGYVIRVREEDAPDSFAAGGEDPLGADPLDDPFGRAADPAFPYPLPPTAAPSPAGRVADPFDREGARPSRATFAAAPEDEDDDLFRGIVPSESWHGAARPDHAEAPRHAFIAPKVMPASPPSEIDFDALIGEFLGPDDESAAEPPVAAPVPARREPAPAPPPPRPAPAPVAPPPAPPVPDRAEPPGVDAAAALAAFLEGAGVPDLRLGDADPQATLRAAGEVFRVLAGGLREVLMSRAAIKGELRVDQTMIGARDNNGLKFSATTEEAVGALLGARRTGYLPPLAAAQQGFADIKSHELAVMSGVQTALVALLKRFDPDALEARLTRGRLDAVLPGARKARYWDAFRETYGAISREAEDDFQAAFGRVFARAYTAQTRKE